MKQKRNELKEHKENLVNIQAFLDEALEANKKLRNAAMTIKEQTSAKREKPGFVDFTRF